jgi:hypothetical protein
MISSFFMHNIQNPAFKRQGNRGTTCTSFFRLNYEEILIGLISVGWGASDAYSSLLGVSVLQRGILEHLYIPLVCLVKNIIKNHFIIACIAFSVYTGENKEKG